MALGTSQDDMQARKIPNLSTSSTSYIFENGEKEEVEAKPIVC